MHPELHQIPMYKGLQQPLEIMGLQGRYIIWAAATAGIALTGSFVMFILSNFLVTLIFCIITVLIGTVLIMVKSRKGLHTKHEYHGIYVFYLLHDK